MKQVIFLVVDNGIDGKAGDCIVYASTNENERDEFYDTSLNKNWYRVKDVVEDLDTVAVKTWDKLNALEKLSLERVDCKIWLEKAQSKYSL
jgi:hypothetical protein